MGAFRLVGKTNFNFKIPVLQRTGRIIIFIYPLCQTVKQFISGGEENRVSTSLYLHKSIIISQTEWAVSWFCGYILLLTTPQDQSLSVASLCI